MSKPPEHFRNYILSLLGDRDYEKVIETVAKIDKDPPATSTADTSYRSSPFFFPPKFLPPQPRLFFPSQRFPQQAPNPRENKYLNRYRHFRLADSLDDILIV